MALLFTITGNNVGQSFSLDHSPFRIGRTAENQLVCQDGGVSRKHAIIEKKENGFVVKDLHSLCGTLVNGKKITRAVLHEGDEIRIGVSRFLFVVDSKHPEIAARIKKIQENDNQEKNIPELTRKITIEEKKPIEAISTPKQRNSSLTPFLFSNQTSLFIEIANAFAKPQDLENLCSEILEHILTQLPIRHCFLFLWDEISRELEPYTFRPTNLEEEIENIIDRERLGLIVEKQKVSLKSFQGTPTSKATTSILLPMIVQGNLIGALQIDFLDHYVKVKAEDLPFFKGLVNHLAVGIHGYQQTQSLLNYQEQNEKLSKFVSPEVLKDIIGSEDLAVQVENTLCSILFSDIQGFTSMSERLPPRRIAKLLNEYFSLMVGILFAYNGSLDKFIGDAIMAIFGAPISREDDADRAVATAVEMQQAIHKMNQKRIPAEQFNVRIGINTGYCVAGRIGSYQRMEYTVLGDTVNLASRIESNGKAGHVLIGEATRALLSPTFEVIELDPVKVKNKANPIRIFDVVFPSEEN